MHYNNTKQQFLFCNSLTPHKVIAFAPESTLKLLSENCHWNNDGTLCTSPASFTQAYYRHVWVKYSMKSVVYSCCEDKSQDGYERLFRSLVDYAAQRNIASSILIDFEQAAINAFNNVFPQTLVNGCYFHFAQNAWKKVTKIWSSVIVKARKYSPPNS